MYGQPTGFVQIGQADAHDNSIGHQVCPLRMTMCIREPLQAEAQRIEQTRLLHACRGVKEREAGEPPGGSVGGHMACDIGIGHQYLCLADAVQVGVTVTVLHSQYAEQVQGGKDLGAQLFGAADEEVDLSVRGSQACRDDAGFRIRAQAQNQE